MFPDLSSRREFEFAHEIPMMSNKVVDFRIVVARHRFGIWKRKKKIIYGHDQYPAVLLLHRMGSTDVSLCGIIDG